MLTILRRKPTTTATSTKNIYQVLEIYQLEREKKTVFRESSILDLVASIIPPG